MLAAVPALRAAEPAPLPKLKGQALEARLRSDAQTVKHSRAGLAAVLAYAQTQTNLFPATRQAEARLVPREDKEKLWTTWKSLLDHMLALDTLRHAYGRYYLFKGETRSRAFLIGSAACLAQYRFAVDWIKAADNNPALEAILNEPVPEIGLPERTFARLKLRYLNVVRVTEFAACDTIMLTVDEMVEQDLRQGFREDARQLRKMGFGPGEILTVKHALAILRDTGQAAWFPVQAGVSAWMGDVKVHRVDQSLIAPGQIRRLQPMLHPGDILLERREWYLSNIGLPGFWPHAALYIGTAEERQSYFNSPEVAAWVRAQGQADGSFENLLRAREGAAVAASLRPDDQGHLPRVLEAMSEGVCFTTLEHSAAADCLAVLRPRLPRPEKALALLRAFHYSGRPYDFNFDFATDATLVCTELVFKAYEPTKETRGLVLPLVEMLGRKVTPANEFVRQYDQQWGTPAAQFELILFLDGREKAGQAVEATHEEFRQSWRRPRWHILTQPKS